MRASAASSSARRVRVVRPWVADRLREDQAGTNARTCDKQAVLGLTKILDTNFDQRPNHPKTTRRPYCFGSAELRAAHYREMRALHAVYHERSERYRAGERDVRFPPGTYPPPLIAVAA